MGLRRLFKKARRTIKKLIPKEIRPFVPYIAAAIPGLGMGIGALGAQSAMGSFLRAGIAKGLTDDEANLGDVLRTGAIAAAPQAISKGLGSLGETLNPTTAEGLKKTLPVTGGGNKVALSKQIGQGLQTLSTKVPTPDLTQEMGFTEAVDQAKLLGTQTGIDVIQDQIKLQEQLLDDQGITDKSDRRQQLFDYFTKIDYGTEDEINSLLDKYGYKGFAGGGSVNLGAKRMYDMMNNFEARA